MVKIKKIGETLGGGMEGRRQVSALTDFAENSSPLHLPESMKNLAGKPPICAQAYSADAPPRLSYFHAGEGFMTSETFIGVDVAKKELVISSEPALIKIANTEEAIDAWLAGLPSDSQMGLEATGCYHQLLTDRAVLAGLRVYVLNPRDTRHYALGLGRRSKTDRVDAEMIRRLVAAEHPHLRPYQAASDAQRQLALLQRRRACVVKHRQALQKALRGVDELAASLLDTWVALDALLTAIDQKLNEILASQAPLMADARRLESIPGIGRQTSTQLAVLFNRVPLKRSDAVVAFVGFDPRACDSGQKKGRRRLSKRGPGEFCGACFIIVLRPQQRPPFGSLTIPGYALVNSRQPRPW
jgi:transposase